MSNRISVNNAGIKTWQAKTTRVRLEYYFQRVGQVSIGAFRRDIDSFLGSTRRGSGVKQRRPEHSCSRTPCSIRCVLR